MKRFLLFILLLPVIAAAQTPVSPVQLTINSAYIEPSTGLHWYYNGTTYLWYKALGVKDSTYYITPWYASQHFAPIGSGVTSFNTRTGAVVPLVGDYSSFYGSLSQQNTNTANIALRELLSNKATGFGTLNNTLYPTTQAVANYVSASSPVLSVFGRTGAVTAQSGDYASYYLGLHATADNSFKWNNQSLNISGLANGDYIKYNSGSGVWENIPFPSALPTPNYLTLGYGFTGQPLSFNGSSAITAKIDTSVITTRAQIRIPVTAGASNPVTVTYSSYASTYGINPKVFFYELVSAGVYRLRSDVPPKFNVTGTTINSIEFDFGIVPDGYILITH